MERKTIEQLKNMRESEDKVEFKEAAGGSFSYNGSGKEKPGDRRKCILGYIVALCNEGGGYLVFGMHDSFPHKVVGTKLDKDHIGELESKIYNDLRIRPEIYELYEEGKRVLVIQVPGRPLGKVFKFEDVALMRVGEELKAMDEKTYLSIIEEQEPDFSEKICDTAHFEDLSHEAIELLKNKYSLKQHNIAFKQLSDKQALSDLDLIKGDLITNAAVILVGKREFIESHFPQSKIMLEYRNTLSQIPFDNRQEFIGPFYCIIEDLWNAINSRNGNFPVREGAYIFDIPFFNEDVIREAINNAIAHRDYRCASEIVIKQYPILIDITNAGGFPQGVTIDNLLSVPSTPRNRLLANVLSKTGIVERSGQGIDKIFLHTLSEGKPYPNYTQSDEFNVRLILSGNVKEKGFAMFINSTQNELPDDMKLSVFDVIILDKIRSQKKDIKYNKEIINKLLSLNLIEKRGKTNAIYYILSRKYYEMTDNLVEYSKYTDWDIEQFKSVVCPYIEKYKTITKSDLDNLVGSHITEKQIRSFVQQLKEDDILEQEGKRKGAYYKLSEKYFKARERQNKAIAIGLEELKKRGE